MLCWVNYVSKRAPKVNWGADRSVNNNLKYQFWIHGYICKKVTPCNTTNHIICDNLCLLCIEFYVWDAVSIFNHLPRMFFFHGLCFRITDWTCCYGPYLHAILRIISRGVSGLATDSPCGVWGHGWTICLLHDSPLFGSHFKMRVGM